ncbi:hypothetical protein IQ272_00980 [Chroococcidiopsidales cyanobacterium LEGE 13417]|nr:hypothetical protein [Chroococcidiopsidales cyanobacterium LEGE 13417]
MGIGARKQGQGGQGSNYQLPITHYQLPTTNHQFPTPLSTYTVSIRN